MCERRFVCRKRAIEEVVSSMLVSAQGTHILESSCNDLIQTCISGFDDNVSCSWAAEVCPEVVNALSEKAIAPERDSQNRFSGEKISSMREVCMQKFPWISFMREVV